MYFLAFFSVVASYSNLSTVFNGCKDKHYLYVSYAGSESNLIDESNT